MNRPAIACSFTKLFLIALALGFVPSVVQAANLKLEARLIWATDSEKSPDPSHKPVDPATADRLKKAFKWKYYFVVNRIVKNVPSRSTVRFDLSKKCALDISELQGPRVEVKLIGDGKPLHKTVMALAKGETITYTGDDKNETAWFVIITDLDEK